MCKDKKDIDAERDAVDRITESMHSLEYLNAITEATFSARGSKITLREFYDDWAERIGTKKQVPLTLGAVMGYLYLGVLFAKENWFNLLPDDPLDSCDEAWGLRDAKVVAPKKPTPTLRYVIKRLRNALGHGGQSVFTGTSERNCSTCERSARLSHAVPSACGVF